MKKNNLFIIPLASLLLYNIFTVSQIVAQPDGDFPEISDHSDADRGNSNNNSSSDSSNDSSKESS